jgi:DNA-binding transcriptional LysR family regulator
MFFERRLMVMFVSWAVLTSPKYRAPSFSVQIYLLLHINTPKVSMTDLRHLRHFLAVAEELHFGRAAQRLHMTQPPLTMSIRQMELEIGVKLFERTSRSVVLTPAGAVLMPIAQRLLDDLQRIPATLQAAAQGRLGRLRLGFVSTMGFGALPQWLRSFRALHPDVELALQEATFDVQLAAFAAGEMDAGFVLHAPGAPPVGFQALSVSLETMVLALPAEHPLALADTLPVSAVLQEPLLVFPRRIAPSLYDALLSFYSAHQCSPPLVQEAIQMQTIVNLVSAGMGVAWVPESVMQLQRPGVHYRRVQGAAPSCETSLIWPTEPTPVVQRFVQHVQAVLQSYPPHV